MPIDLGRRLFDAAGQPKTIWLAPGGRHENLADFGAIDVAIDFVQHAMTTKPTG